MSMFVKNSCAGCWGEAGSCTCPKDCTCYSCAPVPHLKEKMTTEQEEAARVKDEQLRGDLLKSAPGMGRSMANSFFDQLKKMGLS